MIYRFFFRLLARLDVDRKHFPLAINAEQAHHLGVRALAFVGRFTWIGGVMRAVLRPSDPRLEVHALGLTFANPLGVAAGLDKYVECFDSLGDLGFGHVEVGTVTARGQDGNPGDRLGRLLKDRALHNRMGFPNPGAVVAAERLGTRLGHTIIGANIGKTKDVDLADAPEDYATSVRLLAPVSDYLVLNVSSPNTPGLRSMQGVGELRELVEAVRAVLREIGYERPLLVKIGPDLANDEIEAIADLAVEVGLEGIVAVNTTVDRGVLQHASEDKLSQDLGGISGAPLKRRALEVLQLLRSRVGDDLVLVSVGGIETVDDAWERITAGATLLQAHTGFVYGGPLWPRRINRQLARHMAKSGCASIQDAVGIGAASAQADVRAKPVPAASRATARSTRVA